MRMQQGCSRTMSSCRSVWDAETDRWRDGRLQGKGGKGDKQADRKAERVRTPLRMQISQYALCALMHTVRPRCTARMHATAPSSKLFSSSKPCILKAFVLKAFMPSNICPHLSLQAAARGKQAEVPTQPDPSDPLAAQYGDAKLVRSEGISGRVWTPIDTLTPELKDQKVQEIQNMC